MTLVSGLISGVETGVRVGETGAVYTTSDGIGFTELGRHKCSPNFTVVTKPGFNVWISAMVSPYFREML